jgi:hypothetical protein
MAVEEIVLEKFRHLPPEQQQEVLDFVEFLEFKHGVTLEDTLAQIRERSGSITSEELDALVEEARQDFHVSGYHDSSSS